MFVQITLYPDSMLIDVSEVISHTRFIKFYPRGSISNNVFSTFDMADLYIVLLQNQSPPQQMLIVLSSYLWPQLNYDQCIPGLVLQLCFNIHQSA